MSSGSVKTAPAGQKVRAPLHHCDVVSSSAVNSAVTSIWCFCPWQPCVMGIQGAAVRKIGVQVSTTYTEGNSLELKPAPLAA